MYNRHIEKLCRTRLDDVLLDEGITERSHVEDAQAESEVTGRMLSQVLFDREVLDEWDLAKLMARHYSLPYMCLDDYRIPDEALALLPLEFCREHCIVPIEVFGTHVAIAVTELPSVPVLKELGALLQTTPFIYVAVRSAIQNVIAEIDEDAYTPREVAADPLAVDGATGRLDLPGITMRLGYSMHARSSHGSVPLQSLRTLAPRAAPPAGGPTVAASSGAAESGEAGKSPAAWQEIFDLGDGG